MFQKILIVRWINSNEVWHSEVRVDNLIDDLKTGVLMCNILKFHMPNIDFSGLNVNNVRSKKPCLNNIEKSLQIMYQKGMPSRYILTAEEIFEGVKVERIWLMLRQIFEVFAMHDVNLLRPKILAWITSIIQLFNPDVQIPQAQNQRMKDFYNTFRSGLPLFYIFYLYIKDENLRPNPAEFYEIPMNIEEVKSNLHLVCVIQGHINVPIYLTPNDYISQYEPNFLLLQLYYLYCRFRNVQVDGVQ